MPRRRRARLLIDPMALAISIALVSAVPVHEPRPSPPLLHAPGRRAPAQLGRAGLALGRTRLAALVLRGQRAGNAPSTYPVARTALLYTEPWPGGGRRLLPTRVWYPAVRQGAPYPLVVFAVGYDIDVSAYGQLLREWAAAGFVVAAPQFPHNSPDDPPSLDESDIVNHPADLRFVIASVLRTSARPGSPLSGIVNGHDVAVAGHSDGADVALAVAYNSCCRARGVRAVLVLAGAELDSFGGRYFAGNRLPMLVVQGNADTVNPPACSSMLYDAARQPKYYLDLLGAGHEPPFAGPPAGAEPYRAVVERVTTQFLEGGTKAGPGALARLHSVGDVPGVARLTDAALAPSEPGTCPGA